MDFLDELVLKPSYKEGEVVYEVIEGSIEIPAKEILKVDLYLDRDYGFLYHTHTTVLRTTNLDEAKKCFAEQKSEWSNFRYGNHLYGRCEAFSIEEFVANADGELESNDCYDFKAGTDTESKFTLDELGLLSKAEREAFYREVGWDDSDNNVLIKMWELFQVIEHDFYADGATPCEGLADVDTSEPGYGMYYDEELGKKLTALAKLSIDTDDLYGDSLVFEGRVARIKEVTGDTIDGYKEMLEKLHARFVEVLTENGIDVEE